MREKSAWALVRYGPTATIRLQRGTPCQKPGDTVERSRQGAKAAVVSDDGLLQS
jgi:hypothetical protein